MMKSFVFRPDVAIADTAFYAYGKTFEELAVNSCKAVTEAMVNAKKIQKKESVEFSKKADTLEELLYSVMEEVIYLKDAKQLVFNKFKVTGSECKSSPFGISMLAKGEKIDRKRHDAHSDVKAVTYHDYYVEQTPDGYKASVTLDV